MKKINTIEMSGPLITKEDENFIIDVMRNGWYGEDKYYYVEKFEKDFATYHNRKYGLMTPNCTTAIHLILHSLGIKKGHNVINQDCTWVAAAAAVSYTGARNNLVDIDAETWCLDHKKLEAAINKRTKAIIVSDIYGNMPFIDKIIKIANKYKIPVIEDSAEALGSKYKNKKAGSFGIASTFSFHRTKTITTGEGGMLVTNNKKLFELCKFYRDQGRNKKSSYRIDELGFKYMPFNLQAALGYSQFLKIKKIINKKRFILKEYKNCFKKVNDIQFNLDNKIFYNGCWATTIVIGKSHKIKSSVLIKRLSNDGLPVRPFFMPLSSMKPFNNSQAKKNNKISYDISSRGITLPSALNLNKEQIKYYSNKIINILNEKKK